MKLTKFLSLALFCAITLLLSSCHDSESYADLLNSERHATNAYLSNHRVVNDIPADTVFETGENAPFYRLTENGDVYMQVIKAGDRENNRVKDGQKIYFRYMRYNLNYWYNNGTWNGSGNEQDMSLKSSYFVYNNYSLTESAQWGYGLQMPLSMLGIDCEVNLVIKSQYGVMEEFSYVQPFMYHVRYFKSQV